MNQSCHSCDWVSCPARWVMSWHIGFSHAGGIYRDEQVMSLVCLRHVIRVIESCHSVTHVIESCSVTHVIESRHVIHVIESYYSCDWVMSWHIGHSPCGLNVGWWFPIDMHCDHSEFQIFCVIFLMFYVGTTVPAPLIPDGKEASFKHNRYVIWNLVQPCLTHAASGGHLHAEDFWKYE